MTEISASALIDNIHIIKCQSSCIHRVCNHGRIQIRLTIEQNHHDGVSTCTKCVVTRGKVEAYLYYLVMTVDTLVLWLGTTMKFTTHLPFHLFSRALIEKIRFECWETWRQGTPGVGFHSRAPPRGRGGGSRDPGCHRPCCRSPPTRLHQCSLIRADNQQMSSSQTFQIVVDLWRFRIQFTSENINVTIGNRRYLY